MDKNKDDLLRSGKKRKLDIKEEINDEPNENEDLNVPEKGKKCKRGRPSSRNKNLIPQSKAVQNELKPDETTEAVKEEINDEPNGNEDLNAPEKGKK